MTDPDVARLRELCEKATPGPWGDAETILQMSYQANRDFAIAARELVLPLIDDRQRELDRIEAHNAVVRTLTETIASLERDKALGWKAGSLLLGTQRWRDARIAALEKAARFACEHDLPEPAADALAEVLGDD